MASEYYLSHSAKGSTWEKKTKYIDKIKLPNGKYQYIYAQPKTGKEAAKSVITKTELKKDVVDDPWERGVTPTKESREKAKDLIHERRKKDVVDDPFERGVTPTKESREKAKDLIHERRKKDVVDDPWERRLTPKTSKEKIKEFNDKVRAEYKRPEKEPITDRHSRPQMSTDKELIRSADENRQNGNFITSLGLSKVREEVKATTDVISTILKRVNPSHINNPENYREGSLHATDNCVTCSLAVIMQLKGYDTHALAKDSYTTNTDLEIYNNINKQFTGAKCINSIDTLDKFSEDTGIKSKYDSKYAESHKVYLSPGSKEQLKRKKEYNEKSDFQKFFADSSDTYNAKRTYASEIVEEDIRSFGVKPGSYGLISVGGREGDLTYNGHIYNWYVDEKNEIRYVEPQIGVEKKEVFNDIFYVNDPLGRGGIRGVQIYDLTNATVNENVDYNKTFGTQADFRYNALSTAKFVDGKEMSTKERKEATDANYWNQKRIKEYKNNNEFNKDYRIHNYDHYNEHPDEKKDINTKSHEFISRKTTPDYYIYKYRDKETGEIYEKKVPKNNMTHSAFLSHGIMSDDYKDTYGWQMLQLLL